MNTRDDLERVYDALAPTLYRYALMVLADPFMGAALIYRKTADGYTVYGLGDSRQDRGGLSRTRDENGNRGYRIRLADPAS